MLPTILRPQISAISISKIGASSITKTAIFFQLNNWQNKSIFNNNKANVRNFSIKEKIQKLKLIEQPPGYIVGTVNDAFIPPPADFYHGAYHWSYERIIGLTMIPLTIAPFVSSVDYPLMDSFLSVLLLLHCNAGFQSCIIDYIPKRVYGIWHKFAMNLLLLGTVVSSYGIYLMETEDIGLTGLISKLWSETNDNE
ncbi:CybS family protein [Ascoidea rubescens DSM 1968]|uniref:Succinate dehydrogenase [ubiquinone] cytochrome b small subunit n=1 Tax=Ascoidea rubescens DSM 1968 TaxID=1344418 RepID=A0A1D2VA33_9ASCO|nr:CybS-domain-containing protein [Ascoidea rubescens DSM 1968]ODV58283.1 CybS-domain-containing protein [Ascoidea rubescens DSM 1968]